MQYLEPAEHPVLRFLFNWVYGVFENLHYSPNVTTQDVYLDVFKHVFANPGNDPHYKMMMVIDESKVADHVRV